jgi:hypothetical protein
MNVQTEIHGILFPKQTVKFPKWNEIKHPRPDIPKPKAGAALIAYKPRNVL